MKQLFVIGLGILFGASALAYKDGTYNCKNSEGLPANVYKISTQAVGDTGVPFVDVHRYFKNADGKVTESKIRGYAVVADFEGAELLTLAAFRIEFRGDEFYGCIQE